MSKGKYKPRRNFKKNVQTTTQGPSMNLETLVTKTWNLQKEIDNYNLSLINDDTDPFLKDVSLKNNYLVFKPFKENFVKDFVEETKTIATFGFRQIDNRKRSTDQEDYVISPYRFINAGVLVSAPDDFLEDYNMKIGDVIYTKQIRWNDSRFYLNRQDGVRDYVKSQDNWTLSFFEGYFFLMPFDIQLSMDKEVFKEKHLDKVISAIHGKITLEELIETSLELQRKLDEEKESQQMKTDTFVGEEINIDTLKGDDADFTAN